MITPPLTSAHFLVFQIHICSIIFVADYIAISPPFISVDNALIPVVLCLLIVVRILTIVHTIKLQGRPPIIFIVFVDERAEYYHFIVPNHDVDTAFHMIEKVLQSIDSRVFGHHPMHR